LYIYLRYTFKRNRGQEAHIRDRVKKAAKMMGIVIVGNREKEV